MPTPQELIATTHNFYSLMNIGQYEVAAQLLAPDFFDHASPSTLQNGRDSFLAVRAAGRKVLGNTVIEAEDIRATNDGYVTARVIIHATHIGPYKGIPTTFVRFAMPSISIMRWDQAGLMAEHWEQFDILELMRQLGASFSAPPPTAQVMLAPDSGFTSWTVLAVLPEAIVIQSPSDYMSHGQGGMSIPWNDVAPDDRARFQNAITK